MITKGMTNDLGGCHRQENKSFAVAAESGGVIPRHLFHGLDVKFLPKSEGQVAR